MKLHIFAFGNKKERKSPTQLRAFTTLIFTPKVGIPFLFSKCSLRKERKFSMRGSIYPCNLGEKHKGDGLKQRS